jgi:biopolymer transport protein ExbD
LKIRTNRESLLSLESVAITDIILNMFIFFFTSFSLVYTFNPSRESRIQVKLPQADVRTPAAQVEPIVVTIDAANRIYLGSKLTTLTGLTSGVESALGGDATTTVIVRSDRVVIFDRVIQVLDAVKKSGAQRLSLAVEEKGSPPGHK